jgi:hypothetical protein
MRSAQLVIIITTEMIRGNTYMWWKLQLLSLMIPKREE